MRTLLLIMTIVGGLLSLAAAGWVASLSRKDRWLQRNLYRLGDEYAHDLKLHSQAYQAYGNQLAEHQRGQARAPVPPFDGMDERTYLRDSRHIPARSGTR